MKRSWLAVAALGAWLSLGGGCSSTKDEAADTSRRCTPGNNVACLCANGESGTHVCNEDGKTFGECRLSVDETCPGGEQTCNDGESIACTCDGGESGKQFCESNTYGECQLNESEACPAVVVDAGHGEVDTCPGKLLAVGEGANTVNGDTTGGSNDANGADGTACAVGSGPDDIYSLVSTATGSITVAVAPTDPTFDPTVYFRTDCVLTTNQRCAESGGAGKTETLTANVVAGTKYFLFVDGKGGSAGKYKLTVTLKGGGFCGDGKVGGTEACDDKNNVDGDGCGAGCNNVNGDPDSGKSCPGQPVHVYGPEVIGTGSTTTFGNTFTADDSLCTNGSAINGAQDHVYAVTAHKKGTMTVKTSSSSFKTMLVVRSDCTNTTAVKRIACNSSQGTATNNAIVTFPVDDGGTYFVAVDGTLSAYKGTYSVSFAIQ